MIATLLSAALAIGQAQAATPDRSPLTAAEIERQAPEALTRRLFGEVAETLFMLPVARRDASAGLRPPLRRLRFLGRPRTSSRAGICETDRITLELEPVPQSLSADPPLRPRRLQVATHYLLRDLDLVRADRPADAEERSPLDQACAALDPRQARLVFAGSEREVAAAANALADLAESAAEGRSPASLDCTGDRGEALGEAECLRRVAHVDPLELIAVDTIAGCGRGEPDISCRRLEIDDSHPGLEIVLEYHRAGSGTPSRVSVRRMPSEDEVISRSGARP